jgi:hypothetical protein
MTCRSVMVESMSDLSSGDWSDVGTRDGSLLSSGIRHLAGYVPQKTKRYYCFGQRLISARTRQRSCVVNVSDLRPKIQRGLQEVDTGSWHVLQFLCGSNGLGGQLRCEGESLINVSPGFYCGKSSNLSINRTQLRVHVWADGNNYGASIHGAPQVPQ